jgi:hypothetical protein
VVGDKYSQSAHNSAVSEGSAHRNEAQVDNGVNAAADRIWEIYKEIGEEERHFNQIQHQYRILTSTWLLATFAATGYALTKLETGSNDAFWLTSYKELIVAAIALFGAVGIRLLWLLDIKVYHQLLDACFVTGVKLERRYEWLPPLRNTMLDTQSAQKGQSDLGVLTHVKWFYIVCTTALLAIGGLFLAIWLSSLLNELPLFAEVVVVGVILLMLGGAISLWGYSINRQTRSYSLESLDNESEST